MPYLLFKTLDGFIRHAKSLKSSNSEKPKLKAVNIYKDRAAALRYEKRLGKNRSVSGAVYVTTDKGTLEISETGMVLHAGEFVDLSRMPLSRLEDSKEIRGAFDNGLIRFVTKKEIIELTSSDYRSSENFGLRIFDSIDEVLDIPDNCAAAYNESCTKFHKVKKKSKGKKRKLIKNPKKISTVSNKYGSSDPIEFNDDFGRESDFIDYGNGTYRPAQAKFVKIPPKSGEGSSSLVVEID